MKRFSFIQLGTCFLVFILLMMATVSPVRAQEGETPQIVLSVFEASPGATIEIIGGRFEPDVLITFFLFQNGHQTQMGTIFADFEGNFTSAVLLPYDLQPGQYEFHAVDERNRTAVALFAIVPDPGGEGNAELRDEDDNLLAPMPTFAPGVIPGGVATQADQQTPANESTTSPNPTMTILFGLLIAVALLFLGIRFMRKR